MRLTPHQKEVVELMKKGWELQYVELTMSYTNLVKGDQKRPVRYETYSSLLKKGVVKEVCKNCHTTSYALTGGQ